MAEPRSPDLRARLRERLAAGPGVPPPLRLRAESAVPCQSGRGGNRDRPVPRSRRPQTVHAHAGADHERPPGTIAPAAGRAGRARVRAAQAGAGRCEPGPRRGALLRRRSETRAPPPACAAASRRPATALRGAGPGKQSGRPPLPGSGVSGRCEARATGAAPVWDARERVPGWAAPPCAPRRGAVEWMGEQGGGHQICPEEAKESRVLTCTFISLFLPGDESLYPRSFGLKCSGWPRS